MWKMYKNGQKVYKILNKKKYIELSQGPHSSQDYQEKGNEILNKMYEMFCMDHENKENPQIFVTCPVCFMLCSYDSEIIEREGICGLSTYFSMEASDTLSEFYRRFSHMFI